MGWLPPGLWEKSHLSAELRSDTGGPFHVSQERARVCLLSAGQKEVPNATCSWEPGAPQRVCPSPASSLAAP